MKRTIYIIILILVTVAGCEKSDFLNIKPENLTLTEDAFQTPDDVWAYLNSSYDVMRNGSYWGGNMFSISEIWSKNCGTTKTGFGWSQIINNSTNIFNTEGRSLWQETYRSIDRANYANKIARDFEGMSDEDKTQIMAQSYFINAVGHFELVRFFALPYDNNNAGNNSQPGLPIRTEGTGTIPEAFDVVPRATVEQTYSHIINYLETAAGVLPEFNNGYATSWACKAFLAKVYFQMNDIDNAFLYADEVIESGMFSLDSSLTARFDPNEPSQEVIFEMISTASGDNSAATLTGDYRQDGTQNPSVFPSDELSTLASSNVDDKRWQTWFNERPPDPSSSSLFTYCAKYDYDYCNVPLAYLAEIYLIRAECGALGAAGGSNQQALNDVNKVIERAFGNNSQNLTTTSNLVEEIRKQRRLETCFEGSRMHELKRIKAQSINGLPWNDKNLIFEIPDIELNGNPDMIKNH
jgi:hypothetical protein